MARRVKFLMGGKFHEGRVVRENHHTTVVQVKSSKLDILGMRWTTTVREIKRHNIRHQVQPI